MAEHTADYDALGLPVECGEPHPVTGNGCIEPRGHDGLHRSMGAVRMQGFGAEAACVIPPGADQ